MSLREAALHWLYDHNMNCAEALLHAANDVYALGLSEDDYKLLGGFGGGCGCGSLCGAVAAGVAALGYVHIGDRAHNSDAKAHCARFVREVQSRLGSELCSELRARYYTPEKRCGETVALVADTLDELWQRN